MSVGEVGPYVGTAGWSLPRDCAEHFAGAGTVLERYAGRFAAVEINSSFYRPHRRATYARWAGSTPDDFRFAVKLPRTVTHERRLAACEDLLDRFLDEAGGLGRKLGVLLVQLPPSLAFEPRTAGMFLVALRRRTDAAVVLEPRHRGWWVDAAAALLVDHRVARVAADPAPAPGAGVPGGWPGLVYWRLHGSPRMYYSDYDPAALGVIGESLRACRAGGTPAWCIFDNTALGAATRNALAVAETLHRPEAA